MGAPTLCCCAGGCNGWTEDGDPATGFGDGSSFTTCVHCDAIQNSEEDCCGPPTPQSMTFQAQTKWMWSWHRAEQADCLVCMGQNTPEVGSPVSIPGADWDCSTGNRAMYWGGDEDLGTVGDSGGWWINGGAIDMTVELDQVTAASTSGDDGGAVDGYPPGCCAKYYYGKCDVTGPLKPGFTSNPLGYGLSHFASSDIISAPGALEAFGRLSLLTGGWAVTGDPDQPPRLVLQATFSLFVCIRDAFPHYTNCVNGVLGTQMGTWTTRVYQPVEGCSCGNGISLVDQLDWSSLTMGGYSAWNYAWELPILPNQSESVSYTQTPGPKCDTTPPSGSNCPPRTRCPVETFTTIGIEACCDCSGTSFPPCRVPWGRTTSTADVLNCDVYSGRKDGLEVWSYPWRADISGNVIEVQDPTVSWGVAQTAYDGLPAEDTSWRCIRAYDSYPCDETTDTPPGCNTGILVGGFQGGGTPQTGVINQFPACGLTDVQFDIGAQDPYA